VINSFISLMLLFLLQELLDEEGFNAAVEMSVEEGTTSANAKAIKSSPQSKSLGSLLSRLATSKPVTTQDVDVKIWQETSKTNVDKGEDSLDQSYFLMLPPHPFHFEF